jgi:hypothetical protein
MCARDEDEAQATSPGPKLRERPTGAGAVKGRSLGQLARDPGAAPPSAQCSVAHPRRHSFPRHPCSPSPSQTGESGANRELERPERPEWRPRNDPRLARVVELKGQSAAVARLLRVVLATDSSAAEPGVRARPRPHAR